MTQPVDSTYVDPGQAAAGQGNDPAAQAASAGGNPSPSIPGFFDPTNTLMWALLGVGIGIAIHLATKE